MSEKENRKIEREKDRLNDFLHLAKVQDGEVETKELAKLWGIHPEQVDSYVNYLIRHYDIPLTHVEKGFPTYHFNLAKEVEFYEVDTILDDKSKDLFYPTAEPKTNNAIRCYNCGRKSDGEKYCGYCGNDLEASK